MYLRSKTEDKTVRTGVFFGERKGGGAKEVIRYLTPRFILLLCGYFAGCATLPFGARPFGVALLSAVSGGTSVFVYIGLVLSAFFELRLKEAVVYFGVYTAVLLFRALINIAKSPRTEPLSLEWILKNAFLGRLGTRVLVSAGFSILLGAVILFAGGMLYYDLFALLASALLSPIVTAVAYGFFEYSEGIWRDLGFFAIACISVFGARDFAIYGVSVAVFGSLVAIFYFSYLRGAGFGIVFSVALGLCYSPILAPTFVIAAICSAVFIGFSPALACFCTFAASSAWAFYAVGLSALLGVFGGILAACLTYTVIHKIIFVDMADKKDMEKNSDGAAKKEKASHGEGEVCKVLNESDLDGIKLCEMNLRMCAISNALKKVSSVFSGSFAGEKESFSQEKDVEFNAEKYNYRTFSNDDAPDLDALSSLLTKIMEQGEDDYKIDTALSEKLCFALSKMNLRIFGIAVFGVRKKTIYIKGKRRTLLEENVQDIIDVITPLLPFSLCLDGYEVRREGEGDCGALLISERENTSVSIVRRSVIARDESVCGDSTAVFKNRNGHFFAMISDGMGSGVSAAAVAQVCTGFISNMLSVGNTSLELISALNGVICGRCIGGESERSATLDLFELDLMNGGARIYKCGAAPSYIYRKGKLFKVRSQTMPLGILRDADVKSFSLELCRGDVVVMVSDGVSGEDGECPWLFDLLTKNLPCRTLESTAELIVKYSVAKGSGDDVSVLLIKIG